MSDNKNNILKALVSLNLSLDEARLYLELLKEPSTHLDLSRDTGINRTKVYRLADELEKRSLLKTVTDDQGMRLVAAEPEALEISLITNEEKLNAQRNIYKQALPVLQGIPNNVNDKQNFLVHTYEGSEGLKQMLWHELKTKGELLIFGSGKLEDLVENTRWAERHRAKSAAAGYKIRELLNPGEKTVPFTKNQEFLSQYCKRYLTEVVLNMRLQIAIYNDTVATYNWREDEKIGIEVVNKANADMYRQMFESYWKQAKAPN